MTLKRKHPPEFQWLKDDIKTLATKVEKVDTRLQGVEQKVSFWKGATASIAVGASLVVTAAVSWWNGR